MIHVKCHWYFIWAVMTLTVLFIRVTKSQDNADPRPADMPVLVWWTPFTGDPGTVHDCGGQNKCYITEDRSFVNDNDMAAALFYGTDFSAWDLPLPRSSRHLWALLHEESPKNAPIFCHRPAIQMFNITATFRMRSNVPLTLQHLPSLEWLTSRQFVVPFVDKFSGDVPYQGDDGASERLKLSPVVYLASSCDNPSERDEYVRQLGRFIDIDCYGECLNNRSLPGLLRHRSDSAIDDGSQSKEARNRLYSLLAGYKFYLALENAVCQDYITEKLWRPLGLGVVPVYLGAPNVRRWLPCSRAAIVASDFESPAVLAAHLHLLAANASAYGRHLCHKSPITGVTNWRLKRALRRRQWDPEYRVRRRASTRPANLIEAFECSVCRNAWRVKLDKLRAPLLADMRHYGCARPPTLLSLRGRPVDTWWTEQWDHAAYEARVLADFVAMNSSVTLSRERFRARVLRLLNLKDEL